MGVGDYLAQLILHFPFSYCSARGWGAGKLERMKEKLQLDLTSAQGPEIDLASAQVPWARDRLVYAHRTKDRSTVKIHYSTLEASIY